MRLEYPSQRLQDWLSQRWVMWRGARVDPASIGWLMGPFGYTDVIGDEFIARLAAAEGLTVERGGSEGGLLASFDELGLAAADRARLRPEISHFYECTWCYDLEIWSGWSPLFRPFGGLLRRLYSRRLRQLNVPLHPLETARGMRSELVRLCDETGRARYTVWYRLLRASGLVVYSGVYSACRLPDGTGCVKVVFPLPRGNATVIMRPSVGPEGDLVLRSSGEGFGGPGFYFLLVDKRGRHWAQFIRSFREEIRVFVDDDGVLRADHLVTLWRKRVFQLHYRMVRAREHVSTRMDSVSAPMAGRGAAGADIR